MPRVTRSTELLSLVDGLFYLDNDEIDKTSCFYTELKVIAVNYGEEVIENLIPHITILMSEHDVKCKEVCGLKGEIELLAAELLTAESKVDNKFKY